MADPAPSPRSVLPGSVSSGPVLPLAPVLSLADVRLTLAGNAGPVGILKGVTVDVNRGETVALTGASGSGKSSLLMVMAGLERAGSGRVQVLGRDLSAMDEDALARFRAGNVGIVFQSFHLIPTMTALENVALPLELAGRNGAAAFAGAREWLAAVGLAARADHYPAELSGGEQQRTALARALAPGPALLLADEPTGNLDADSGAAVIERMFSLAAHHGTTLVLVTHDAGLAARCARVLRLEDGRLREDGAREDGTRGGGRREGPEPEDRPREGGAPAGPARHRGGAAGG